MPKKLEAKLKEQYGANSVIPYKIMNKAGLMPKKASSGTRAKAMMMEAKRRK